MRKRSLRFVEKICVAARTLSKKTPFLRKTRSNHTIPRGIKRDARVIRKELALSLFKTQNFPSTEEPAAGWAGWAQRGRFYRSICQLVLLPHSCQITRPIPSWPSHFSSRFFLSLLTRSLYVSLPQRGLFRFLLFFLTFSLALFSSRSVFIISTATQISPLCAKARFSLCIRIDKLPCEDERDREKGAKEREKKGDVIGVCVSGICIFVASMRTIRTCPGLVSQSTKDYARLLIGVYMCAYICICTRDFLFRVHRM